MADASPNKTPKAKLKSSSSTLLARHEHENPSKFFLYKAALVTVFIVLVPFFPSLAPDFINQTLHARSWELLQLIFVGIAVSYGLFSKKNDDEPHKDNINAQSYVSKLLQVSSVFDDESDNHTLIEENKFEALNSQYYRGEAVVVKENPLIEEKNGVVSQISQKPLLLPVRSLKQRVPSQNELDSSHESNSKRFSTSTSIGSGSSSTSSRKSSRNGEVGGLMIVDNKMEEKKVDDDEKVVLRSPIPWRSRSGRLVMKEENDECRSFSSSIKGGEDVKKSFSTPPPAPPPPPPPPPPSLRKSNSSVANNVALSEKVLRRSVRSVPKEELSHCVDHDQLLPKREEALVKSVRTFRPNELGEIEEKKEKEKEFRPNEFVETTDGDDDDDEDDDESDAGSEEYDQFEGSSAGMGEGDDHVGRDVDKKADEFIAKFREQIRLQRIESIRRSTAQRAGKSLR